MGYIFELEDANLLGWLTWHDARGRSFDRQDVIRLLRNLERGSENIILSPDSEWRHMIHHEAREVGRRLSDGSLSAEAAVQLLRGIFGAFPLYALTVGRQSDLRELEALVREQAVRSDLPALFLCPRGWLDSIDIFAPFPAMSVAVRHLDEWPGLVLWTPAGLTQFVRLADSAKMLDFMSSLPFGPHFHHHRWRLDADLHFNQQMQMRFERLESEVGRQSIRPGLLHISDLHFGCSAARKRRTYLSRAIEDLVEREHLKQVVITGDLFDSPTEEAGEHFFDFRDRIRSIVRKDPIVIPGNHDARHLGMLAPTFLELARVMWTDVAVEPDLQTLFLCFDSSADANLARGRVTEDQRMRLATRLQAVLNEQPDVRQYLRVALIHHHPFSFKLPSRGFWKLLERMGISEEEFLRMEDGEEFVMWCARRGIPLILHGHKHVPNHARGQVRLRNRTFEVDAIGCGSSTGAGDYPLSLNVLAWNSKDLKWSATFYSDPGDGSGFEVQRVTVSSVHIDEPVPS